MKKNHQRPNVHIVNSVKQINSYELDVDNAISFLNKACIDLVTVNCVLCKIFGPFLNSYDTIHQMCRLEAALFE